MDKVDGKPNELASPNNLWVWPLDETRYDRIPILRKAEQEALALLGNGHAIALLSSP